MICSNRGCNNNHSESSCGSCDGCSIGWELKRKPKDRERFQSYRIGNPTHYWAKEAVNHAKTRAKKKNLPCNLTVDYIKSIIISKCPVLDIELDYKLGEKKHARDNSPSLDRIEPEKGYVQGNIIVISYRANSIRKDASVEELTRVRDFYEKLENSK